MREIISFGLGLNFGGAYGGFISTKDEYKRQLAGRIVGKTVDREGKIAYVLTLQAREQHIRRSKATGNICSNQALTALCATLYLSLIGAKSLSEIANMGYCYAHKLSYELDKIGYKTVNKNFFNTFSVKMKEGISPDKYLSILKENNILGGIKTDENIVTIHATEFIDDNDIYEYVNALKGL